MRQDATFASEGAELKAWLFTPEGDSPHPLVVMAHGFSATRRGMTADHYAEVFRAKRIGVLLYDHLGFGDSGGEPRRQINPWLQVRGYRDAISFASGLPDIDPARIGIWGDSFSGAVALAAAGVDSRVAALAIQVPAFGSEPTPSDADASLYRAFEETVLSGDILPSDGEVDGPMPVVSDDQARRPSALTPLTAYRWFIEYGGRPGTGWVNDVTRARPATPVAWHAGLCAAHVTCPSLFMVSPEDEMPGAVPAVALDAYERLAGPKEWVEIDGGHFGLLYHPSPEFEFAASTQARFLVETLRAS
jgi:uncharacterized protein